MSAEADVKLEDFKSIFSVDGKVAVVTGGSRGLGLHSASGYTNHAISSTNIQTLMFMTPVSFKPAAPRSSLPLAKAKHVRKPATP